MSGEEVQLEVRQRIREILADDQLDEELLERSKVESIEILIGSHGWENVRDYMLGVLRDDSESPHWYNAADFFWGAVLDERELPADELIALLYHRFDPEGRDENNLVWSITSKLKGVGYLATYEPLSDPTVLHHLRAIRGET